MPIPREHTDAPTTPPLDRRTPERYNGDMSDGFASALEQIRGAARGSEFEGRVFLVGGALRDRALGLAPRDDIDLVVEGDALALARLLHDRGLSAHAPVLYPRFGTAKLSVDGCDVELASARAESYTPSSRKPSVRRATLGDDVLRRDFTINTLVENLHTGEEMDLTGRARADLRAGIVRTPLDPVVTFRDDPLRMLRAVRFAVRFGFEIEEATWQAVIAESGRLDLLGPQPPVVSAERIRDEFAKTLLSPDPARGMELLRDGHLLRQFAPELLEMVGVTQNEWHCHDVWDHTMAVLRAAPPDAPIEVRLALLLHDAGKPRTRSEDPKGVHFYEHQRVSEEIARSLLHRLKFANHEVAEVAALVGLHMRFGEAKPEWSDAAIRRLIRDTAPHIDRLFTVSGCDMAGMDPNAPKTDLEALRRRLDDVEAASHASRIVSPLDGVEIMRILGIPGGPRVGEAKEFLVNEIVEGRLQPGDQEAAEQVVRRWAGL